MGDIAAILRYFAGIVENGDYLNNWLKMLPPEVRSAAQELGQWLAELIW